MMKKINLGLFFGGKSPEHEVSLQSAYSVYCAIDRSRYSLSLFGIDKKGVWRLYEEEPFLLFPNDPKKISLSKEGIEIDPFFACKKLDVAFPILHGPSGEDGTVQGIFELAGVPYIGADVRGSAIGMDKDVMKRLLRDAHIPTAQFSVHIIKPSLKEVLQNFSFPFFVKPCNMGSSIGISKVKREEEFEAAIEQAFLYDCKILIEEAIEGREIQFALLGNDEVRCSLPCEIIPHGDFHSYESKYIDPEGAEFIIPASFEPECEEIAKKAYQVLCCAGLARVDLFLTREGKVLVNEINTIPGLTKMSPFTKMWEVSGLSYSALLDHLISLALERHQKIKRMVTV